MHLYAVPLFHFSFYKSSVYITIPLQGYTRAYETHRGTATRQDRQQYAPLYTIKYYHHPSKSEYGSGVFPVVFCWILFLPFPLCMLFVCTLANLKEESP